MSHATRPLRSVLYIPGSKPRALEKARGLPVDAIIFDLEDAVAPDEKTAARATLSEALAEDRAGLGNARLFGKVSERNLEIMVGKLGASFDLMDKMEGGKSLRVAYKGALPDTFEPGVEVIVEGAFTNGGELFTARTLVTKCPSKYEEQSRQMEASKG